jgi:hypothetical protein
MDGRLPPPEKACGDATLALMQCQRFDVGHFSGTCELEVELGAVAVQMVVHAIGGIK